jgi:hypothetical protein
MKGTREPKSCDLAGEAVLFDLGRGESWSEIVKPSGIHMHPRDTAIETRFFES